MKVCVATLPSTLSRGIHRVSAALEAHAPAGVTIVPTWEAADLALLHVIGIEDVATVMDALTAAGTRVAVFQYCYQTARGSALDWTALWSQAALVSSYYDLAWMLDVEGIDRAGIDFHLTPLGVDTTVFRPCGCARHFSIATSGYVADQECLNEVAQAVFATPHALPQFHLGPASAITVATPPGRAIVAQSGMDDVELAKRWSRAQYVSGLRRSEGFELPAFEGLACGARPIMFNRPDARMWMGEHAVYLEEGSAEDVRRQLEAVLAGPYRAVSSEERAWVGATFDWATIAETWWRRVLAATGAAR
jgi:hypothetical protein